MRKKLLIVALAALSLCVTLLPLLAGAREPRQIVLVAHKMKFYVEGDTRPNPALVMYAGERVRVVLRNMDPGILHDFAVPDWKAGLEALKGEGAVSGVIEVPDAPGRYRYICTPHTLMMNGVIEVRSRSN